MSNATGTAAVIKAAHAEVVATAVVKPVEIVVFQLPPMEIPVAWFSQTVSSKKISQGYDYQYNHAPGTFQVNSSCMNAGAYRGRRHLVVVGVNS